MIALYGTELPFSVRREGGSQWPPIKGEEHLGPGRWVYICDNCAREVHAVWMGGDSEACSRSERLLDHALRWHLDFCPTRKRP